MSNSKPKIILASASIGRQGLLEKLGVPFEIMTSDISEDKIVDHNPYVMLQKRAIAKAEDIAKELTVNSSQPSDGNSPTPLLKRGEIPPLPKRRLGGVISNNYSLITNRYLIIAADSMAVLGQKTYGKSQSKVQARQMLQELMGKEHIFATAVSVIFLKHLKPRKSLKEIQRWESVSKTKVAFSTLSQESLQEYLDRYDFRKFAAAYTLNETPWDLVQKIDGSYTNVIGLPFEVILPIFRSLKLLKSPQ